jgi:hypothetical protein
MAFMKLLLYIANTAYCYGLMLKVPQRPSPKGLQDDVTGGTVDLQEEKPCGRCLGDWEYDLRGGCGTPASLLGHEMNRLLCLTLPAMASAPPPEA